MLKDILQKKGYAVGTWCDIPSPAVANVIATAGLDFIIIDMEHGPTDYKLAQEMSMAAEAGGCESIIRVSGINESDILKALDTGVSGIIVPHVQNKNDVDKIISFSKYFPIGNKGFNPFTRGLGYASVIKTNESNSNTVVLIMIEDMPSVKKIDEIINNKHVDVVYLGIYDLAVSMGFGDDIKNPKVVEVVTGAIKQIVASDKVAGCMVNNEEDAVFYKKLGVKFLVYRVDTAIIYNSYKDALNFINSIA